MYVVIFLANYMIIFKMKAEYKTLIVDIINLHTNNEPTNIIS
jgi:hypothetical protein